MKLVSKAFYLSSIAISIGITDAIIILAISRIRTGSPQAVGGLILLSWIPLLYGGVVSIILWYKSWAVIQDGHQRTTPGKAVGLFFIPLFNIYWAFQSIWGLSKDFNAYLQRNSISEPRLPEGLFLAYTISCFLVWPSILGSVLLVVNYILALIVVSILCDAINAVVRESVKQPSDRSGTALESSNT